MQTFLLHKITSPGGQKAGPEGLLLKQKKHFPALVKSICAVPGKYPDLESSSMPAFPGEFPVAMWAFRHPYRSGAVPEFHRLP
jgi:hypothetical protein